MHVQSVQKLFIVVKYANMWSFCCRRRRGCLSALIANEPAERRREGGEAAALQSRAKVLCWRKKSLQLIERRVCKVTFLILR